MLKRKDRSSISILFGPTLYNGHLREPGTLTPVGSGTDPTCFYDLGLSRTPISRMRGATHAFVLDYYRIIRIRGGLVFVEFVGATHPRIYILSKTIRSKKKILNNNEKSKCMQ